MNKSKKYKVQKSNFKKKKKLKSLHSRKRIKNKKTKKNKKINKKMLQYRTKSLKLGKYNYKKNKQYGGRLQSYGFIPEGYTPKIILDHDFTKIPLLVCSEYVYFNEKDVDLEESDINENKYEPFSIQTLQQPNVRGRMGS
jgi:hypothetical protein